MYLNDEKHPIIYYRCAICRPAYTQPIWNRCLQFISEVTDKLSSRIVGGTYRKTYYALHWICIHIMLRTAGIYVSSFFLKSNKLSWISIVQSWTEVIPNLRPETAKAQWPNVWNQNLGSMKSLQEAKWRPLTDGWTEPNKNLASDFSKKRMYNCQIRSELHSNSITEPSREPNKNLAFY